MQAQLCREEEVIVVGGGNSAGQAACVSGAIGEARASARAFRGLAETMSRYLIIRIEQSSEHRIENGTEL
jgi:thioredoxin reductase (NADPH)